jgi:hypothetical protein
LFYNDNRGGVDNLNKKVHSFSFRRKCRRWPFRNVCNFLDIAVINGMYLTDKTSDSTKKTSHHMFLKNLGYQLIDEHIKRRSLLTKSKNTTQQGVTILGYKSELPMTSKAYMNKHHRCKLCPASKDRKTNHICVNCPRPACDSHRAFMGANCADN